VENKDGTRHSGSPKKGVNAINSNVIVFIFFLFLSFIFWYLNSLGKDIEADIKYPVKYVNLPKGSELPDDLPSRLNLFMKGPGYSILRLNISGTKAPVEVDYSRIGASYNQNGKSSDYYIVTSGLVQNINIQLKSECKVISIKPDTLFFSFRQVLK
jgi:hypothetical protein